LDKIVIVRFVIDLVKKHNKYWLLTQVVLSPERFCFY